MHRVMRAAAVAVALCLLAAACSKPKETGLPASPTPTPASKTQVDVIDSAFTPHDLTIKPGETVTWRFVGTAPHSVTSATPKVAFNSNPGCASTDLTKCSKPGQEPFTFTFDDPGQYLYYCIIHGTKTGQFMAGTIIVKA